MSYRKNIFEHVFMIPTNRFLGDSVESYLPEIEFLEEQLGQKVPFVIIDESIPEVQLTNRALIDQINRLNKDKILVHFDSAVQDDFFDYYISKGIAVELVDLLHFKGLSYGRVMNKQFLAAAAFGADYIHRRDSDTKLIAGAGIPAEMELKFLGKKVSESGIPIQNTDYPYAPEKEICIVGSGYSSGSDWKIDCNLLLEDDPGIVKKILKLLDYSDDLAEQYFHEIITKNSGVKEEAKWLPQENHPNPDCGNISFYRIHRNIPCSPIPDTIGTDYIALNYLKAAGSPIVYHNHFVQHAFTNERMRENRDYLFSYWPRVANYMDYYTALGKSVFMELKNSGSQYQRVEEVDLGKYENGTAQQATSSENDWESRRKQRISDLGDLLMSSSSNSMAEVGGMLKKPQLQEKIIRNTNLGIKNHEKLLFAWSELIHTAEEYDIP